MQGIVIALAVYLVGINGATFLIYGWDKWAAKREARRVRESSLHWLAIAGGTPGAFLGQKTFRHKTAKTSFQTRFVLIASLQVLSLVGLTYLFLR
jgi:uncharacterized membrane protein YsdA (DUF1294 family)